ncbi:MAG: T9SS type A sorting domain-containing protein [Candidatus Marinimicrobia bacterium]|nr:T9SS type A sorting domain-containing protein [Candidatus Neomarinimicrobiota bacterium]
MSRKAIVGVVALLMLVTLPAVSDAQVTFDNLVVADGLPTDGMRLKPGRILDGGETIWLTGYTPDRLSYSFLSTDGGDTFTQSASVSGRVAQLDAFDDQIALLSTAEGEIWRTADGGATWTMVHSYMISVIGTGWFNELRVLNDNVAVAQGDSSADGTIYFCRTEDQGLTWTSINTMDKLSGFNSIYTYGMAGCNVGQTGWFTATDEGYDTTFVYKTEDAGSSWESITVPNSLMPNSPYSITFADANKGMLNGNGKHPLYSIDGGITWDLTATEPDGGAAWVNAIVGVPGENIFIALCDYSLYYTTDLGATWTLMDTPDSTDGEYFISAVVLNKDFAYFMTQQGTAVKFENQSSTTAIDYEPGILTRFHLQQNYPNPFNPTTTISYSIPQATNVKLVVYTMLGREVTTLIDEYQLNGQKHIVWNATDVHGIKVSSGIYIYRLITDNFNQSRKMLLLK